MAAGGKQVSPAVAVIVIIIVLAIIVAVYYWASHRKPAAGTGVPPKPGMNVMPGMPGKPGMNVPGAKGPGAPGGMKVPVAPPSEGAPETAPSGE